MKRAMVVLGLFAIVLGATSGIGLAAQTYQEVSVSQSSGGGLISDNGELQWQVPPNAYSDNLKIRYTQKTMADFPITPVGSIWAADPFTLDIIAGTDSVSTYNPTTLIVTYNPANLGGRSESTLRVVRNVSDHAFWADLPSTVDTTKHTVTAQATDPGDYGLAVSNVFATAAPAPVATAVPVPTQAPAPTAVPMPVPAPTPVPAPVAPPAFRLGFATLASLIPDVVGQPLENEHYGANGDSLQRTTTGLMVWRKADNWTAFTNGYMTWINGPFGLQSRLNSDRFDWEK